MYFSPHPEYTKKTRCDNNLRNDNCRNNDFFRPIISNPQVPLTHNHDHYYYDNNVYNQNNQTDIERSSMSTRHKAFDSKTAPVQSSFQNDYYTMNYETLNNNYQKNDFETNQNHTRNPVNTRRDMLVKERNNDKNHFSQYQGGYSTATDMSQFKVESTRRSKYEINSNSYIPMPCTLAIPKENI